VGANRLKNHRIPQKFEGISDLFFPAVRFAEVSPAASAALLVEIGAAYLITTPIEARLAEYLDHFERLDAERLAAALADPRGPGISTAPPKKRTSIIPWRLLRCCASDRRPRR
jgi:hypothetical protein